MHRITRSDKVRSRLSLHDCVSIVRDLWHEQFDDCWPQSEKNREWGVIGGHGKDEGSMARIIFISSKIMLFCFPRK